MYTHLCPPLFPHFTLGVLALGNTAQEETVPVNVAAMTHTNTCTGGVCGTTGSDEHTVVIRLLAASTFLDVQLIIKALTHMSF